MRYGFVSKDDIRNNKFNGFVYQKKYIVKGGIVSLNKLDMNISQKL
jgi:hypothetical protein